MDRNYRNLQRAIFVDEAELQRFRQLVVNILLATDIFVSGIYEVIFDRSTIVPVNPPS